MKTAVAVGLAVCLASLCFTHGAEPTSKPTSKPATTRAAAAPRGKPPEVKAAEEAIKAAMLALTKEAQDAYKTPGAALPRTESNYFKDKSVAIDQATLLNAIERSIHRDPRIDAYVKLQLLSAFEKFDTENAKDAIDVFVKSPPLVPLPGSTDRELQTWNRKTQSAKQADLAKINEEFRADREKGEAANAPIIAYRNALREKIQLDDETKPRMLQARVEELSQRATAGYDTRKLWQALTVDIKTWAALAKKSQIASMMSFLKEYTRHLKPQVYDEVTWDDKKDKAKWKDHDAVLDQKRLEDLLEALKAAQEHAL